VRPHTQRKRLNKRREKKRQKGEDKPLLWANVTEGVIIPRAERRLREMDAKYGVGQGPAELRLKWMNRLEQFWEQNKDG